VAGNTIVHGRGLHQGDHLSAPILAIGPLNQILDGATRHGLLHNLRGRGTILRTSLYADDAVVFVAPLKEDINNLTTIFECFGEVTGICTNFQKSSVVPIRCGDVDLDSILEGILVSHVSFPRKYLGLPLSVWQLKRMDFQHLESPC
jgi:hypothetical protein